MRPCRSSSSASCFLVRAAYPADVLVEVWEDAGRRVDEDEAELLMAHASRSIYHTVFSLGLFKNLYLWAATIACFGLLLLVVYIGPLQSAFHTEPLDLWEWAGVAGFGIIPFLVIEAFKVSPWRLRPPGEAPSMASQGGSEGRLIGAA